jgi:hypothetical protein
MFWYASNDKPDADIVCCRNYLQKCLIGPVYERCECVVSTLPGWKSRFKNKKPPAIVPGDIFVGKSL